MDGINRTEHIGAVEPSVLGTKLVVTDGSDSRRIKKIIYAAGGVQTLHENIERISAVVQRVREGIFFSHFFFFCRAQLNDLAL
jgi:hypothetical protein